MPNAPGIVHLARTSAARILSSTIGRAPERDLPLQPEQIASMLAPLGEPFRARLLSMYAREPQVGLDGRRHRLSDSTRISPSEGMWLYNFCREAKPKATLEIGMAYGFSTIYFLAAISRNGAGHHTAVDPYQSTQWHGIGWRHARALMPAATPDVSVSLVEDRSDRAATDLGRDGRAFDIVFVDGNHRFDDVLVDFYLYAPLCASGGHIIFDDVRLPSVQTVAAFIRANRRDLVEVRTKMRDVAVFRKIGEDARRWHHFRPFRMAIGAK